LAKISQSYIQNSKFKNKMSRFLWFTVYITDAMIPISRNSSHDNDHINLSVWT